ncbi:hypothetical protein LguiB_027135 [Lonicera macranthoides]
MILHLNKYITLSLPPSLSLFINKYTPFLFFTIIYSNKEIKRNIISDHLDVP